MANVEVDREGSGLLEDLVNGLQAAFEEKGKKFEELLVALDFLREAGEQVPSTVLDPVLLEWIANQQRVDVSDRETPADAVASGANGVDLAEGPTLSGGSKGTVADETPPSPEEHVNIEEFAGYPEPDEETVMKYRRGSQDKTRYRTKGMMRRPSNGVDLAVNSSATTKALEAYWEVLYAGRNMPRGVGACASFFPDIVRATFPYHLSQLDEKSQAYILILMLNTVAYNQGHTDKKVASAAEVGEIVGALKKGEFDPDVPVVVQIVQEEMMGWLVEQQR